MERSERVGYALGRIREGGVAGAAQPDIRLGQTDDAETRAACLSATMCEPRWTSAGSHGCRISRYP
jgi:hypothetical protein